MSATLTELRRQLREHFPEAHAHPGMPPAKCTTPDTGPGDNTGDLSPDLDDEAVGTVASFKTGVTTLDRIGLPSAAITEIVGHRATCGTALLIHGLLDAALKKRQPLALIDHRDHFDPASASPDACRNLLWLRCEDIEASLKAADLLLRDGNLTLVIADFQLESPRSLRSVATTSWHRLRALAEKSGVTLLAFTPAPLIATAHLRLEMPARFSLDSLHQAREKILTRLPLTVTRRIGRARSSRAASPQLAAVG